MMSMPKKKTPIPTIIGPFHLRKTRNTTMEYGFYYDAVFKLPFAKDDRHIRVWLPPSYDFEGKSKHPVMYMSDGQNLVDGKLSAYGDWHLDRVIHKLHEEGYEEPILVGIDCPKPPRQRTNELNPPYRVLERIEKSMGPNHPIGDRFINYIADELKPLIDSLFSTDPCIEATAIGGSSMGGIMAWYAFLSRPDVFGFSLAFSPPFFFYSHKMLEKILSDWGISPEKQRKIFLYVGGVDFEKTFVKDVKYMHNRLLELGFGEDKMGFLFDAKQPHHEEAWSIYSYNALAFWLKKLK